MYSIFRTCSPLCLFSNEELKPPSLLSLQAADSMDTNCLFTSQDTQGFVGVCLIVWLQCDFGVWTRLFRSQLTLLAADGSSGRPAAPKSCQGKCCFNGLLWLWRDQRWRLQVSVDKSCLSVQVYKHEMTIFQLWIKSDFYFLYAHRSLNDMVGRL